MTAIQILIIYLAIGTTLYSYALKHEGNINDMVEATYTEEERELFRKYRFILLIIVSLIWPYVLYHYIKARI